MNKHKNMVRTAIFVEKMPNEMVHEKTFTNKPQFFLVSSWRYQDFRHIFKNPKVSND